MDEALGIWSRWASLAPDNQDIEDPRLLTRSCRAWPRTAAAPQKTVQNMEKEMNKLRARLKQKSEDLEELQSQLERPGATPPREHHHPQAGHQLAPSPLETSERKQFTVLAVDDDRNILQVLEARLARRATACAWPATPGPGDAAGPWTASSRT